ncbi:hypothetical protein ABZU75_07690 [Streptosporangium sp. NPDC005286]|uniref:hypothetical protein n=1 Tax=Streptosporangium sp. NPDC005286 TaxID=3154463 RepID=UPI0033B177EF
MLLAPGQRSPDTRHRSRVGFVTVDIEAELIEGWRPLHPTRGHDAGLPFLLPLIPGAADQGSSGPGVDAAVEPLS